MKRYFADANIFLRLLLRDNEKYYRLAKKYFEKAKRKEIVIVLTSETLLEVNYVLRSVYSFSHQETAENLKVIVYTPYLSIPDREPLMQAIEKYNRLNVDLADLILYEKARLLNSEILTFDKSDFKKIRRRTKSTL